MKTTKFKVGDKVTIGKRGSIAYEIVKISLGDLYLAAATSRWLPSHKRDVCIAAGYESKLVLVEAK